MADLEPSTRSGEAGHSATGGLFEKVEQAVEDIRGLVACKICTRPMYEPYVTTCGHSFCYSCLSQWFVNHRNNKTCPGCRAKVTQEPVPDFTIRDLVNLLTSRAEMVEAGETTDSLRRDREEEANIVERDKANENSGTGGIFKGCFSRRSRPIYDPSDRVARCPRCNWELVESFCPHCDEDYGEVMSDAYDTAYSLGDSLGDSLDEETDDLASGGESLFGDDDDTRSRGSDISLDGDGNSVHALENTINGDYTIRRPPVHMPPVHPNRGHHPLFHWRPHRAAEAYQQPAPHHRPHPMSTSPLRYGSTDRSSPTVTLSTDNEDSVGLDDSDHDDSEHNHGSDHGSDLASFIEDGEIEEGLDYPDSEDDIFAHRRSHIEAIPVSDDEDEHHPAHISRGANPIIEISSDEEGYHNGNYRVRHQDTEEDGGDEQEDSEDDGSDTVTSIGLGSSRGSGRSSQTTGSSASGGSSRNASAANLPDRSNNRKRRRIVIDSDEDEDEEVEGNRSSGDSSGRSKSSVVPATSPAPATSAELWRGRNRQRARLMVTDDEDDEGNEEAGGQGGVLPKGVLAGLLRARGSSSSPPRAYEAREPEMPPRRRSTAPNTGAQVKRRQRQTPSFIPTCG